MIASDSFNQAVMKELAEIKAAVVSFGTSSPPGLMPAKRDDLFTDVISKVQDMLSAHEASITSTMERLVGAHAEWQSLDVASRLSRLETIVVCRPSFAPSVDEVRGAR